MQIQDSKMSITTKDQNQSSYVRSYFNQQGLHSERLQSVEHNLSGEHNQLSIECPIHHPVQHILKALRLALRSKNFKGVEVLEGAMLIVRMSFLDRLGKIFLCRNPPKYLIKFETREYASTRILTLKSLTEDVNVPEMKQILNYIQKSMPQPPTIQEQQYRQDIYSLESTSTYMFHKILLNDKYSIGKKMSMLLKYTKQEYKQPEKVNVPPPVSIISSMTQKKLDWAHAALNQISDDMLQGFNCSRKQLVQILGFCRKTVEQYYYSTLLQHQANLVKEINYNSVGYDKQNQREVMQNQKGQDRRVLPLTQKQFKKLNYCFSSPAILRQIFFIHHVLQIQSEILLISNQEKIRAIKQLEPLYGQLILQKVKILESTQYREQYRQYAEDLMI